MRILMLPTSLVLSLLLQTAPTIVRALDNDFSAYPSGSQQCIYDAADQAACTGDTGAELNQCLCRNHGNFIYNTATCVAKQSPSDLVAVYETLDFNCAGTNVTIAVSREAFLAQASAAISSSTPTSTAAPSETSTPGTISSSAKIGIGVGVGLCSIALGIAAWFVWAYSRRRRAEAQASAAAAAPLPPGSSSAGPWTPPSPYSNSYGMVAAMTPPPPVEYAHMNTQQGGAAELAPAEEWKQKEGDAAELAPAGEWEQQQQHPGAFAYGARKTDSNANVPLLAELGEGAGQIAPVELPGSTVEEYQQQHQQDSQRQNQTNHQQSDSENSARYSDQSSSGGQRAVSPVDVLSPTVYSHTGGGSDVSPYSTYSSQHHYY